MVWLVSDTCATLTSHHDCVPTQPLLVGTFSRVSCVACHYFVGPEIHGPMCSVLYPGYKRRLPSMEKLQPCGVVAAVVGVVVVVENGTLEDGRTIDCVRSFFRAKHCRSCLARVHRLSGPPPHILIVRGGKAATHHRSKVISTKSFLSFMYHFAHLFTGLRVPSQTMRSRF